MMDSIILIVKNYPNLKGKYYLFLFPLSLYWKLDIFLINLFIIQINENKNF